jgi:hypothetical protein
MAVVARSELEPKSKLLRPSPRFRVSRIC